MFNELRARSDGRRLLASSFRIVVASLVVFGLAILAAEVGAAQGEAAESREDLASLDLLNDLFLDGEPASPSDGPVLGPPAKFGPAITLDLTEIPDEAAAPAPPEIPAWAQPEAGASVLTDALFASEPLSSDVDSDKPAQTETALPAELPLDAPPSPFMAPRSWMLIDGSPSVNARLAMPILPLNIVEPIAALPEPSPDSESVEAVVPAEILDLIGDYAMAESAGPASGDPLWDVPESAADGDAEESLDAEDAIVIAGLSDAMIEESPDELAFSLNRSDVHEIAETLRLDPRRARHIVEFRTLHGLFASADDLSQVAGVTDEMAIEWDKLGILNFD